MRDSFMGNFSADPVGEEAGEKEQEVDGAEDAGPGGQLGGGGFEVGDGLHGGSGGSGDPGLLGGAVAGAGLHGLGEEPVDLGPGGARLAGEFGPEALLEGPEQGGADRLVVLVAHLVGGVAQAEGADDRHDGLEAVEAAHAEPDRGHQLLALRRHVAVEEAAQRRVEFEEPRVEEGGGLVGDGHDLGERGADELGFLGSHGAGRRCWSCCRDDATARAGAPLTGGRGPGG